MTDTFPNSTVILRSHRIIYQPIAPQNEADALAVAKGLMNPDVTKYYAVHFNSYTECKEQQI